MVEPTTIRGAYGTAARVFAFGLALWVLAIGAYVLFDYRMEIVQNMYAGLGAQLPLPMRIHIVTARRLSGIVLVLVAISAVWLWRRDPDGLAAAKLVSATGLIAIVWSITGLLLGLHSMTEIERAFP